MRDGKLQARTSGPRPGDDRSWPARVRRSSTVLAVGLVITSTAAVAAIATLCAEPREANAAPRDGNESPITARLASLEPGLGHEYRLLLVHPLIAAPPTSPVSADAAGAAAHLASEVDPLTLGWGLASGSVNARIEIWLENFSDERVIVLPGQIVRSDRLDLAFVRHGISMGQTKAKSASLAFISRAVPSDVPTRERAITGRWLPPSLRSKLVPSHAEPDQVRELKGWALDAGLDSAPYSMADLAGGPVIAARVQDYCDSLGTLSRAPAGMQTVGYVALLDGVPLIAETFADADLFARLWPSLLQALAVEAAIAEVRASTLDEPLAPSGAPDRHRGLVRQVLLGMSEEQASRPRRLGTTGKVYAVGTEYGTLRALVLDGTELFHAVLVTSPDKRDQLRDDGDADTAETSIAVLRRKANLTAAEKRLLERLEQRNPRKADPPPPKIPPPNDNPIPPPVPLPNDNPLPTPSGDQG